MKRDIKINNKRKNDVTLLGADKILKLSSVGIGKVVGEIQISMALICQTAKPGTFYK